MNSDTIEPTLLYEDGDIIVVDKPAGMAVHPGNMRGTETTLVDFFSGMIHQEANERSGVVHRLDKLTSGVIVLARNPQALAELQQQFRSRNVNKHYIAAVWGTLKQPAARIDVPIGRHPKNPLKRAVRSSGKPAETSYKLKEQAQDMSLLDVYPRTGRTHQIRVHLHYIGHPVIGDSLYGTSHPDLGRQFLHAHSLEFLHPSSREQVTFKSDLPRELHDFWYNHKI